MKKILIITLLLAGSLQSYSQQDPQYSLYMFNPLGVNPAYAGSREVLSAVLVHRSQWIGLKGAPETQVLSLNTPLRNKRMGLGLEIVNDKIGPKVMQDVSATYAYRLKLGKGKLALGLSAGIVNYNYDWNKIDYKEDEDAIPSTGLKTFIRPVFDFGIYYNTNTFYTGIALDHINQADFNLMSISGIDSTESTSHVSSSLTFTLGKAFILNDNLVLKTSTLVRIANTSGNIDLNASLLIKNKILFGMSLRQNTLVLISELNLTKNLRMGVGYDIDRSDLTRSTSGSFEVFLGYDVGLFKSKVISPRYF